MCGIAGFYNFHPENAATAIAASIQTLKHRGPDADKYYHNTEKGAGLLHTRLSIIDTSEAANQPLYSTCGRFVLVFNGEIYNYLELKKQYLADINFRTESDSEVLLELFIRFNVDSFHMLNGMFAFAIYDMEKNSIYLVRDRLGKKPLFYFHQNGQLIFGSEIKSILPFIDKNKLEPEMKAIQQYLHLGFIPEERTAFKGIKKFPAGSFGCCLHSGIDIQSYWTLKPTLTNISYEDAKDELHKLLKNSVELRLRADVPYGSFLSGGTDSSLMSAIAQKLLAKPLQTFSIGFEQVKFNEAVHAKKVAEHLGTQHHEFYVTEKELKNLLPKAIDFFDEPMADSSYIPTYMVSKLAAQRVKMVITGDGGDELFLGYGMYNWAMRFSNPLFWNLRGLLATGCGFGNNRYQRIAQLLKVKNKNELRNHILSQEQYFFSEPEVDKLLQNKLEWLQEPIEFGPDFFNGAQHQAYYDIRGYLKDDLLVKVDRASMQASIEARSPILDYRIVEFSQNLPFDYKMKDGVQKRILKDILYEYIPREMMDRPKWGFSIPMEKWLRADWEKYREEYLMPMSENAFMQKKEVLQVIDQFEKGKDYYYNRIWSLIVLQQFFSRNKF